MFQKVKHLRKTLINCALLMNYLVLRSKKRSNYESSSAVVLARGL